jgi:poly(beta-D-mannuronate) lyase
VLIAFNTLVNNKANITQSGRKNGLGATRITVANNLVQGGGPAAAISGPYMDGLWEGNIIFNTENAGDMPASAYKTIDPKLVKDNAGIFRLQAGSPAINAAVGNFAIVITDMDGQKRTMPYDVGADEYSKEPVKPRLLSPADVGAGPGK